MSSRRGFAAMPREQQIARKGRESRVMKREREEAGEEVVYTRRRPMYVVSIFFTKSP